MSESVVPVWYPMVPPMQILRSHGSLQPAQPGLVVDLAAPGCRQRPRRCSHSPQAMARRESVGERAPVTFDLQALGLFCARHTVKICRHLTKKMFDDIVISGK